MLLNLSLVTETLINLIKKHVEASPEAPPAVLTGLTVSAQPRDKLTVDNTIGMYLYHVTEDAHFKNLPAMSADTPPLRYTPMGLNLFYQLSAHSTAADNTGIFREQLLIGLAIKALRDYPVIDDSTEIPIATAPPPNFVLPPDLRGADNRFRVSLLPVLHNEALNFSTSGAQPLRLAVYYQVSVVLLEPEKPTLSASRALKYGVFPFTRGAPRLNGSRATVTFTIPGEASAGKAETQPAEVSPRNPLTNTGGEIIFPGSDLAGEATTLLIKNKRFAEPIEAGMDWGVTATDTQVFAVVQPALGMAKTLPGVYSAIARVTTRRMGPDKKLRAFIKTSNETPFVVTPRIDSIVGPSPSGDVTVTGAVFQDAEIESIEVFVGSRKLAKKAPATAALSAGEFEITAVDTLRFQFPITGINSGEIVPFRLIINGAESAPNWVTAP